MPGLEVLISIDLKQSLQPQLDHYFSYLQKHQKHYCKKLKRTREVDRQKWPQLLRVLDAREQGLEFHDIGVKLLGRSSKNKDKVKVVGYAEAEFNTARKMWKKIIPPRRPHPDLELCFQDDFLSIFPPDMPRRILPVLYP